MRLRLQTHHLVAGLLTVSALLSFSCAGIIGADFDKPFGSTGTGGAEGATVSVATTATTATTATSAGGTGGMGGGGAGGGGGGGAGGAGPVATCPGGAKDRCTVYVYVQQVNPGQADHVTNDTILTFDSNVPEGFETYPVSIFTLAKHAPPVNGVALYSCGESDGSHTYAKDSPCLGTEVTLLGYAFENITPSSAMDYDQLISFSTNDPSNIQSRSLITKTDQDSFCGTEQNYGTCSILSLYAPH